MINDDDRYNDDHYDFYQDDPLWMRGTAWAFRWLVIYLAVLMIIGAMAYGYLSSEKVL